MSKSPLRKAEGPSRSDYGRTVALKLSAFILALAVFLALSFALSRPKAIKDLSDGAIPFTFTTRSKELQRELVALNAEKALPGQAEEAKAAFSKHLCSSLSEILGDGSFERMKAACDQFAGAWEAHLADLGQSYEAASYEELLEFIRQSPAPLDAALDNRQLFAALNAAFSSAEAAQGQLSFKSLAPEAQPSPLPELQKVLQAKLNLQLAANDFQGSLRTLDLMFKMAGAILSSTQPDIFYLSDSLLCAAKALKAKPWPQEELKELLKTILKQRARGLPQRRLLSYEREKAMLAFERVRQTGLRSLSGAPPGVNMMADSLRELKPLGFGKALGVLWSEHSYDPDADELDALRMISRIAGPGFMPYFKAAQTLSVPGSPQRPISDKLRSLLLTELYKQSEAAARLDALEIALKTRLGIDCDKAKQSPLNGKPCKVLTYGELLKVSFGQSDESSVTLCLPKP